MVQLLIENNYANVNVFTPFMTYFSGKTLESLQGLEGEPLSTPLMTAAFYNYTKIVDLLLKNGADPLTSDHFDIDETPITALTLAELNHHIETTNLIQDKIDESDK